MACRKCSEQSCRGSSFLAGAQNLAGRERSNFLRLEFFEVLFQLTSNLVDEQIDHRVKILGLFLRGDGQAPGFDSNFTVLPVFVNCENQMNVAGALEQLAEVREFALRV